MEKPFVFGVATSGDNFTDREKETQRLLLTRYATSSSDT